MSEAEEFARFIAIIPPLSSDERNIAQLAWHDGYRTAKSRDYGPWPAVVSLLGVLAFLGWIAWVAVS